MRPCLSIPTETPQMLILVLAAPILALCMTVSAASQELPSTSDKTPKPVPASAPKPSAGPEDPALRKDYEEVLAAMRALESLSDDGIRAFDQRVVEMAARLTAGGEDAWASRLDVKWGAELSRRGRLKQALAANARATEVMLRLGDEAGLADITMDRGSLLQLLSRYDEAISEYEKAARVFERIGNVRGLGAVAANRGAMLGDLSRYAEALSEYDKAASAFEKLGEEGCLAKVAANRGNVFSRMSRYAESLSEYEKAAGLFDRIGDEPSIAKIALNRGVIFGRLSRYAEALAEYAKAERVFDKLGDEGLLAQVAMHRADDFLSLSRYAESLAEYAKAYAVFEKLGDEASLASIAWGRGMVFRSLSRYAEALAQYEKAGTVFAKLGDEQRFAGIAQSRGIVFQELSRYEEALSEFEKAARVFERFGDEDGLAGAAGNRGSVLQRLSRYEEALSEYEKAARVFEKLGHVSSLAHTSANMGLIFQSLSRYEEALSEFEKAGRVFEKLGDEGCLASIAVNRGEVLRDLSRYPEALSEYDLASRVFEKLGDDGSLAKIAMNRGNVYQSLSRYDEALGQFADASELIERVLQSQVQKLGEASSAAYRKNFRRVVEGALMSATSIARMTAAQRGAAYKVFGTFMGLGTAEMIAERGDLPALDLSEEEDLQLKELTRETREAVAQRDQVNAARHKASPEDRKKLDDQLTSIVEALRVLELKNSIRIERARQRQQVYVGVQYPKAATVEEVQSELDPGVALLEYAADGGELFAFVTTRTTQRLVALGDAAQALKDVEHVHETIVASRQPDVERLRRLGECILGPLLSGLTDEPKVKTLLIAAHGDLARIPFEPLIVQDPTVGTKPNTGTLLLNRFNIAYVHSGTVMRAMRLDARHQAKPTGPEFVGVGFPSDAEAEGHADCPETGLKLAERSSRRPLPGTAREVLQIARHFAKEGEETQSIAQALASLETDVTGTNLRSVHGERFHLFLREEATEKALKEDPRIRTARILHLGCHGEADLISPALSRLVLARAGHIEKATGEDGYVYLRELRDLGISAELLVLSACETNAGKLHPLEGVTGLSRAGLAAGADSVISTFWRVDDSAAQQLVADFYERWLVGGATRTEALGAAKRRAIELGMPIRTWSAYALWDAQTN